MINNILNKYEGSSNYWYPDVAEKTVYCSPKLEELRKLSDGLENELLTKYKPYIPDGWYGFSLGTPVPPSWISIIDDFLQYLIGLQQAGKISGLEINQIKIKFGGIRFYVHYACADEEFNEYIRLQIAELERHLYDSKLIY